jgi:hypothetical protein
MKFLLMCCIDEKLWTALPGAERDRIMDEYGRFAHELKESGRLLAGANRRRLGRSAPCPVHRVRHPVDRLDLKSGQRAKKTRLALLTRAA